MFISLGLFNTVNLINECIDKLNNEEEAGAITEETGAYGTYLPLYLYYNHTGNQELAKNYITLAYEAVGDKEVKKYHSDPNRDTNPKKFYSRDIIKTYEKLFKK